MTPSDPFDLKPKTIEDHNRQAEQALAFFLRDFPQTYRLLAGSRFQAPVLRQADYMNYAHSIYGDAWTIIRATPCRVGRWEGSGANLVKCMYLSGERLCRFQAARIAVQILGAVVACPVSGLRLN